MTEPNAQLRSRLSAIDPMRATSASETLEHSQLMKILESVMITTDQGVPASAWTGTRRPRRRSVLLAAAAALVLATGVGVTVLVGGGESQSDAASTMSLSAGSGASMSSCVGFDVAFLREMPVAFAGTVSEITAETVSLDVERWYQGGEADVVTISLPDGQSSAALDGVEFVQGSRYLVSATNGVVNGCGFSGPATPELEAAYAEAFPG